MVDESRRRFLQARPSGPATVRLEGVCLGQQGVECRLCGDVCEPRALRFTPSASGPARLVVDAGACTACGQCIGLCPVQALRLG